MGNGDGSSFPAKISQASRGRQRLALAAAERDWAGRRHDAVSAAHMAIIVMAPFTGA
jgi:hypothetical protein